MLRKWKYCSPAGTLYIIELEAGTFCFKYKGELGDTCDDPEVLADNVLLHSSGCDKWDSLPPSPYDPSDLSEWEPLF